MDDKNPEIAVGAGTRKNERKVARGFRPFLIIIGSLSLGIGVIAIVVPILPSTPFLFLTCFLYAKSSRRLSDWLMRRQFIAKPIRQYKTRGGLTLSSKLSILGIAGALMGISAIIINKPVMYIVFGFIFALKTVVFFTMIKTVGK